jgi:hypothetical protein
MTIGIPRVLMKSDSFSKRTSELPLQNEHLFEVVLGQHVIKRLPIKGLVGKRLPLAAHIERMQEQARSEERQRRLRDHLR